MPPWRRLVSGELACKGRGEENTGGGWEDRCQITITRVTAVSSQVSSFAYTLMYLVTTGFGDVPFHFRFILPKICHSSIAHLVNDVLPVL